jgi:hypothetical protein
MPYTTSGRLAQREADAVFVDLAVVDFVAEAGDHGAQVARFDAQRVGEVVHGGAHRHRADQLVRLAAGDVIGFRQQQLGAAARQQARDAGAGLGAPLLERGFALGFEVDVVLRFLPAEQRGADRGDRRPPAGSGCRPGIATRPDRARPASRRAFLWAAWASLWVRA